MPQGPSTYQQEHYHASSGSHDTHPHHRRRKRTGCRGIRSGGPQTENTLEIVIGNGPHAGTYKPPAESIICVHYKKEKRYTAAWKDFDAHDAKAIAEAGINVSNPDDAGAKHGEVRIAFGDPNKQPIVYSVDRVPLMMTMKGKGAEISFQGKTKDGTALRMTTKCSDIDQF